MSADKYTVLIFMSTYNGEKYLDEQICTILKQRDVNIKLLIRDDGSKDKTLDILQKYASRYENIKIIKGKNVGFAASFLKLIYECDYERADYYAFSDQDDIWDDDKVISGIKLIDKCEKPMFYYSAQRIVDNEGNYLRDETCFRKVQNYSKYSASMVPLTRGCTQIWNNCFHKIVLNRYPNIEEIYSHDFWVSLIAFWTANMVYDDCPHMGYRQTGDNVSGSYKNNADYFKYIYKKAMNIVLEFAHIREKAARQAELMFDDIAKHGLLTAHYRDNMWKKMKLIFSDEYRKGLSLKWNVFNMFLIISNRL